MVVAGGHTGDVRRGSGRANADDLYVYAVVGVSIACVAWPWAGGYVVDAYIHTAGDRGGLFVADYLARMT